MRKALFERTGPFCLIFHSTFQDLVGYPVRNRRYTLSEGRGYFLNIEIADNCIAEIKRDMARN